MDSSDNSGGILSLSILFSHRSTFLLVFAFQLLTRFLPHITKNEDKNAEKIRLRQEISQLLREANSLSTPSTFAQSAKLRRQAAAKEKELAKYKEESVPEHSYGLLNGRNLFIVKAILYLCLCWRYWGVPVVVVPPQLLQPFGKMMSWRTADPSTGLIPVGIVPWLVLTSQVSDILCQKLLTLLQL